MDVIGFEREAETFCRAVARETYLQRAGLKESLELRSIYGRHQHLFTPEAFEELEEAEVAPRYRRLLEAFVARHFIAERVAQWTEQLAEAEATATVEWEGERLGYRAAPVRWANLGTRDRRHALNERWRQATAGSNTLRQERHSVSTAAARDLGFPGYVELWDRLHELELATLSDWARRLLADTDQLYHGELRDQLVHAEEDPAGAWKADLDWVFRAPQFDQAFGAKELLPTLHRTLAGLGLRLEEQTNIRLDTEYRPNKSPRAFCARLDVPDDVRLVLMPRGGRSDYDTLLHEAGHAEHFANVDRTQPFAHRWLGDSSVTEAYAFLLHYLTLDRKWLELYAQIPNLTDYLRVSLLNKLYLVRRYATKLLYEQRLHRTPEAEDEGIPQAYAELFTQNLGVEYSPEEYLSDVDDAFYAAQYLRAWALEAQLRGYLQSEFDEEWFRQPRAGRFLVELWREGQKYSAEELASFMGYEGLDFAPLVGEMRGALPG